MSMQAPLLALLEAAATALPAPVGRRVLSPGTTATWDECCEGQIAWETTSITPITSGRCVDGLIVEGFLSVVRCITTLDDNGNPPSMWAVTSDGVQGLEDAEALLDWLTSVDPVTLGMGAITVNSWRPLGASGGCAGGAWSLTLRY